MTKHSQRGDAVQLRRDGASYGAILHQVGVAKSTLWRWLKAEGLVETDHERLLELKRIARQKAVATLKAGRLQRTRSIMDRAQAQIGSLSSRELWLIGVTLYWAEGAKQKPSHVSQGVAFSNSDPFAVTVFIEWLRRICGIPWEAMTFDIYLHVTASADAARVFWIQTLRLPSAACIRVYWKKHNPRTNRHNTGPSYHGVMRVKVRRSTALNRTVSGWIQGIVAALGSGVMVTQRALDPQTPGSTPGSPVLIEPDVDLKRSDLELCDGSSLASDVNGVYAPSSTVVPQLTWWDRVVMDDGLISKWHESQRGDVRRTP